MTDDLHTDLYMEGVENPGPLPEAPELSQSSSFTAANTAAYPPTDGSCLSLNGSGPSTPTHENVPSPVADLDGAKAEIFQPYDVEEPDEEPGSIAAQRPELPCLPDSFERWQRDLTEYMDGMGQSSNKQFSVKMASGQRRGQKRKSPNISGSGHVQSSSSPRPKSKTMSDEQRAPVPGLGPKRRRRRSKLPEDAAKATRTASLYDFREAGSTGSSSSDLHSTDASSAETPNESVPTDEMDID